MDEHWEHEPAPAGFDGSAEVFSRARRLAEAMFGAGFDAHITLLTDDGVWNTRGEVVPNRPGVDRVRARMRAGQFIWITDTFHDEDLKDDPFVRRPPHMRFLASAPIRVSDGSVPGALWVWGPTPQPFDGERAGRLQDVADFVADEWARARAERAEAAFAARSEAARLILHSFIQSAPLMLLMLDHEFRILSASSRWLEWYGVERSAAQGESLFKVVPQVQRHAAAFARCLAGEALQFDRAQFPHRDGSDRWVQVELTPWRGEAGEVAGVMLAAHDITGVVEALEESERNSQWLKFALEISDTFLFDVDFSNGKTLKAGSEETFFGGSPALPDLSGALGCDADLSGLVDPRDLPILAEAFQRHLQEGVPFRPEFRTNRPDDEEIWALASMRVALSEEGQFLRTVGALQNITERKRSETALIQAKEQAETATRAKSAFLATMGHEIRTPLNGVLGMAQAMANDSLSEAQRGRLDVIRQSGEALLAILNDLLDLSKIEAGKVELERREFDLVELAKGAHATFAATAEAKGLEFGLEIASGARGVYVGDTVRVRQILYNLVSNALKFTERGRVDVAIAREGGSLVLTVSDTGIGIPPEKLASLFQKFEQADASTTRRYGGTGLGLAICRELCQLMGGSIRASSAPGVGATFEVKLPLSKRRRRRVVEAAAQPIEDALAPQGRPLRVLAAEDNAMNQLVLKTLLNQMGVDPVVVDNGQAAVDAWSSEPWDLILMDVQMPVMDGLAAARSIRAHELAQALAPTPIVALTANAMDHQVNDYRAAGMNDFIAKPIEAARLYQVILEAARPSTPETESEAA